MSIWFYVALAIYLIAGITHLKETCFYAEPSKWWQYILIVLAWPLFLIC